MAYLAEFLLSKDYVEMQWLMLQQDKPDDYVIATGEQHSVREFVELIYDNLVMQTHIIQASYENKNKPI